MDLLQAALDYIRSNPSEIEGYLQEHLRLSASAILIGFALCFPLGVLASRSRAISIYSLNLFGVVRAIPSVALLFVAYPYLGSGFKPALLALAALACPPILINTNIAFRQVDPALREAAYGMGMNTWQVLQRVEFPLALPVVIAGLRTATVEVIASATLATFIGVSTFGLLINQGLQNSRTDQLLAGAIPVALLTLGAELLLGGAERLTRRG